MTKSKIPDPKAVALRRSGTLNGQAADVSDPLFRDNAFFDSNDLVQVKYEMLRRTESDGMSITAAAFAFGFSRPAFYEAREALDKEGLTGLIPRKRGPKGGHKLTKEVLAALEQDLAKDPDLGAVALAQIVLTRFGVSAHPRSIERALLKKKRS